MLRFLLTGLGLGFGAAAQPGPLQTYYISQALSHGWRRTVLAAFAPLLSDGPIIVLVLFILNRIPDWFTPVLYFASGFFILYLAWNASQQWKNFQGYNPGNGHATQSLLRAAMTNLLNPGPYLFWSFINGPLLLEGWKLSAQHALVFLLGFYGSMIATNLLVIMIFGMASHAGDRARRIMVGMSALALAAFGSYQLWLGFTAIL